jgi:transposase
MDTNTLLADPVAIEIEKFVSLDNAILIVVKTIQPTANCPKCNQSSGSLKTRYLRSLSDLPWHNVPVRIELHTRKFRCRNEFCSQKVFCERLEKVVVPFARRTVRLAQAIEFLAFALGARATARTATKLGFQVGKDVCLRVMRRRLNSINRNNQVSILGVDDFAFRRGINYGTILVDLESREPIDLLPDRTAETLSKWLAAHPEIEVVSRDRSTVYAEAVRSGAPQAAQVADRWHLLKNLSDLIERFFINNHCLLTQTSSLMRAEHLAKESEIPLPVAEKPDDVSNTVTVKPVPARRQKLFDLIKVLRLQGKSIRGIARELKVARNTVKKYICCEAVPYHRSGAGRPSTVLPFAEYLKKRWREGEQNGFRLWQEIRQQGFSGEVDAVRRFICEWRKTAVGKMICPISSRGLAPRKTTKLLLNPESAKNEAEYAFLTKLCEISPAVGRVQRLGMGFQEIVKEKRADLFDDWLTQVKMSEIKEFQNWADNLLADEEVVRNALSSSWSNGQTEGQVNRLKTIKRQMYGRANFDLLRARILHRG